MTPAVRQVVLMGRALRTVAVGQGLRLPVQGSSSYKSIVTRKVMRSNARIRRMKVVLPQFMVRQVAFTASTSGTTMTVSTPSAGVLRVDQPLSATGILANTYIVSQDSGTAGGIGSYTISKSQTLASRAFTGPIIDELFAAAVDYQVGIEVSLASSLSGLAPRSLFSFLGLNTGSFNPATWDVSNGYLVSDWLTVDIPAVSAFAIWTVARNPTGLGVPTNLLGSKQLAERYEGFDFSTTVDYIANDVAASSTSIGAMSGTALGTSFGYSPAFLIVGTRDAAKTVAIIGDSIANGFTGATDAGSDGYTDSSGTLLGNAGVYEIGYVERLGLNTINFGKPSDRATWLAADAYNWRYRLQGLVLAAPDGVLNAYGQNDQTNSGPSTWAATTYYPPHTILTTSSRVYYVKTGGTSGASAPTSTTAGVDITNGTNVLRYIGTSATATTRAAWAMIHQNSVVNAAITAALPTVRIAQAKLIPYSTVINGGLQASDMTAGFGSANGIDYNGQIATASVVGATIAIDFNPILGGSSAVTGGADDGTRTWLTDGVTTNLRTFDGLHPNGRGAVIGGAAMPATMAP